ncbi:HK97 family phage prohead protease [Devosia neptuniae]|uniref:HK97 family phage prohead protease n=1 Tax=Devosia neptuniae TaxID=191302 RepID=A0ABY6CH51_9HYPH|nr:HK97 family phage prohead protease [Devosia neptuniae]UXN70587.1 HK97 family phage prohead protease [Devosia neptuniae]
MPSVNGYAALFQNETVIAGEFRERIARGAFSKSLRDADVVALLDHDTGRVIGRKSVGTLTLREDLIGLWVSIDVDNSTPEGQTVLGAVTRQDLKGMSFGFRVRKEEWADGGSRLPLRTLTEIELHEVSVVAFPAYERTSIVLSRSTPQSPRESQANAGRRRAEAAMRRRGIPV